MTYSEENIEELQEYILEEHKDEIGVEASSRLFQEVRNTLTSNAGKDRLTESDIDSLAESY